MVSPATKAILPAASAPRGLGDRRGQHVGAEVRADHATRSLASELEREIAGAGCDVEREGAGRPRDRGRLAAPSLVEPHRHQAVDEVVARDDAREHRAHEGGLAGGAGGKAALGGGAIVGGGQGGVGWLVTRGRLSAVGRAPQSGARPMARSSSRESRELALRTQPASQGRDGVSRRGARGAGCGWGGRV